MAKRKEDIVTERIEMEKAIKDRRIAIYRAQDEANRRKKSGRKLVYTNIM